MFANNLKYTVQKGGRIFTEAVKTVITTKGEKNGKKSSRKNQASN